MKKDLKVVAMQARVPKSSKEGENQIKRLVKKALTKPVDMVGLPEDCLSPWNEIMNGYEPFDFLSKVAKENKVYLFGATIVKEKNGDIHNTGFLFDKQGKLIARHNKVVLTPPEEKDGIRPGKTLEVFDTEFGKMAILVCKDSFHRYAAWFFDKLMKEDVDIVLIPSSSITVSERSINLWTDTIKTMSMLFNVFIVAPGTVGVNTIDNSQAFGNALIVSPQKVVLAQGGQNKEEVLIAELDKNNLERLRSPEAAKWQPNEVPTFKIKNEKSRNKRGEKVA